MERLERVVEAGGRLLKVDQLGAVRTGLAGRFLLTFDVGRLLLELEPGVGRIRAVVIEGVDEIPAGVEDVSEEDPWWRVIGSPLTRVEAGDVGAQGLRLQFRADHENPRIVALQPSGSEIQLTLEAADGSA